MDFLDLFSFRKKKAAPAEEYKKATLDQIEAEETVLAKAQMDRINGARGGTSKTFLSISDIRDSMGGTMPS